MKQRLKKKIYYKGRIVVDYDVHTDLFGYLIQYSLSIQTDDNKWYDIVETTNFQRFREICQEYIVL